MNPEMDRKRAGFVLCIVLVGVVVISQLPPMVFSSFEWDVKLGDSMTFKILVTGNPRIQGDYESLQWFHLNNTVIIANVTHLPTLVSFYTSDSFIVEVVNITKVSCIFENGTQITGNDRVVTDLISMALIPIGSWNELDSLFLDDYIHSQSFGDFEYTWVSRYENSHFFFSHHGDFAEGEKGWKSHISITSGIPKSIEWYEYRGWGNDRVSLQLDILSDLLSFH